jgi:hypothetical protein
LEKVLAHAKESVEKFNSDLPLRYHLWTRGFEAKLSKLPGFCQHEKELVSSQLNLVFSVYNLSKETEHSSHAFTSLFS